MSKEESLEVPKEGENVEEGKEQIEHMEEEGVEDMEFGELYLDKIEK